MNLIYCKNLGIVLLVAVGVFLASTVLFSSLANAAEEAQIQAAIKDLSSATGQAVASEDQAKTLCNQEQYLDVCADIGKKHELYAPEELKQVDSFLSEVKGKILDDIKNCDNEECLVKVASELAIKIKTKNPTLATDLNLTTKIVAEKQAVVQAAKEVGVNFKDCESMDPDIASIDLLRKCAKLAKDTRVQKYIPEEKRALAAQFDDSATIKLREALSAGKYQCGDGTLDGCGNYCLNPDSTTKSAGIPAVCTQIAKEVFGQDGVKQLEAAHKQVGQVKEYYSKKFILTLPNGKELVGEGQIRNTCDQAFSSRNLETAKACGNFAVKNGFASQPEVEKGLKLMESFTQKGQKADFEKCLNDPRSCRDFIPEDDKGQFDASNQIFEIMKTEIGFDPSQCERGAVDPTIGAKCFEGSKRALAKIESSGLAGKSKEARFIIEDIKRHMTEGEKMMAQKEQFKEVFNQKGGPGGCRSETECFVYCSNPTNGPECIAFGSQQNVSGFRGEEAIQKFQEYNQNIQKSSDVTSNEYVSHPSDGRYPQYPGQGPYPGFQPPGQGGYIPGQDSRFTQPGPGFSSPPPGGGGYYPGPGSVEPSPECFAAIQSGDFVKAKEVCYVPSQPTGFQPQICPATPYVECPAGQYRDSYQNPNGCWENGPCKQTPTYSSSPNPTYSPGLSPVYSPSSGQREQIWNTSGLRSYIRSDADSSRIEQLKTACAKIPGGANIWLPGAGDQASKDFGMPDPVKCQKAASCTAGQYFDGVSCSGTSYTPGPSPVSTYSPYPTTTGGAGSMYSCFYPNATKNGTPTGYTVWCEKDYFNCHEGSKTGPSIELTGLSLGAPSSCESGYQGQGCNNNNFCDSNETSASCPSDCGGATYSPYPTYSPPPGTGNCPTGYHSHGESGGFCMNNQENYGGTCYDSTGSNKITCPAQPSYSPYPSPSGTQTSSGSCPSGSYMVYVNNAGGYCRSDTDSTKCGPMNSSSVSNFGSCSSYQSTATYSPAPGTSYTPYPTASSCGSGYYWDSTSSMCKSTCPSTQYWNGSACVDNATTTYTPYPTPDQSVACSSSGGTWNGSTCTYPTTSYTPPPYIPPPSCSSGQYWDGNACVANPTPYPTTSPTSSIQNQYMVAHCQQLGRTWNGDICQANGLFARFYESSGLANILRLFYVVP